LVLDEFLLNDLPTERGHRKYCYKYNKKSGRKAKFWVKIKKEGKIKL